MIGKIVTYVSLGLVLGFIVWVTVDIWRAKRNEKVMEDSDEAERKSVEICDD